MAGRPRRAKTDDNIITNPEELSEERKDQFLKRMKKEEKAQKKIYKKSGRYITVVGSKVLVKFVNSAGSIYTRYWFNAKRYPDKLKEIKANKGAEYEGEFVELR